MVFEWTEGLSVGLASVDRQHKELMMRANELLMAIREHRGFQEIRSFIDYLECYINEHFQDEEKLMAANDYPKLSCHHEIHHNFKVEFKSIKAKFLKNPNATITLLLLQHDVCDWIVNHIMKEDKLYADFIRTKKYTSE